MFLAHLACPQEIPAAADTQKTVLWLAEAAALSHESPAWVLSLLRGNTQENPLLDSCREGRPLLLQSFLKKLCLGDEPVTGAQRKIEVSTWAYFVMVTAT